MYEIDFLACGRYTVCYRCYRGYRCDTSREWSSDFTNLEGAVFFSLEELSIFRLFFFSVWLFLPLAVFLVPGYAFFFSKLRKRKF